MGSNGVVEGVGVLRHLDRGLAGQQVQPTHSLAVLGGDVEPVLAVSGPAGDGHLVGQGGTHAWTEVLVPEGVVAFDPCHGRRTDARYVTVAVGRDYRDVPPTSGSYQGAASGRLTTSRLLESEPLAA